MSKWNQGYTLKGESENMSEPSRLEKAFTRIIFVLAAFAIGVASGMLILGPNILEQETQFEDLVTNIMDNVTDVYDLIPKTDFHDNVEILDRVENESATHMILIIPYTTLDRLDYPGSLLNGSANGYRFIVKKIVNQTKTSWSYEEGDTLQVTFNPGINRSTATWRETEIPLNITWHTGRPCNFCD